MLIGFHRLGVDVPHRCRNSKEIACCRQCIAPIRMAGGVKNQLVADPCSRSQRLEALSNGLNVPGLRPLRRKDPSFLASSTTNNQKPSHPLGHWHEPPRLCCLSVWVPDLLVCKVQVLDPNSEYLRGSHPRVLGNDKDRSEEHTSELQSLR